MAVRVTLVTSCDQILVFLCIRGDHLPCCACISGGRFHVLVLALLLDDDMGFKAPCQWSAQFCTRRLIRCTGSMARPFRPRPQGSTKAWPVLCAFPSYPSNWNSTVCWPPLSCVVLCSSQVALGNVCHRWAGKCRARLKRETVGGMGSATGSASCKGVVWPGAGEVLATWPGVACELPCGGPQREQGEVMILMACPNVPNSVILPL